MAYIWSTVLVITCSVFGLWHGHADATPTKMAVQTSAQASPQVSEPVSICMKCVAGSSSEAEIPCCPKLFRS
jgi:hypothetical protein